MSNKYFSHATAEISGLASIGDGSKIWHQVQVLDNAKIGNDCNLGKGVFIDSNVNIGDRVKIQNGVSVYRGVTVKDDVFLGPNMVFTNDLSPRSFNHDFSVIKTIVLQGASIGANATIICGVKIGEYAMIGAGSVVTKDVEAHELVVGNPARVIGYVCKCGNRLDKTNLKTMECNRCFSNEK
jgi:acetyltransferase-like isoleucine patch superfamily enzyme